MSVFYILILLPILIQHIAMKGFNIGYQKKNEYALIVFFSLLALLMMLRHESVGNDTSNYISFFNAYCQTKWNRIEMIGFEIGYSYFNKIISVISNNPHFFLAIAAGIVVMLIYPTYKRLCVDASLTIVLFCTMSTFVMMFSGIRQMIAISIGFIAYECTRKKQLFRFALMVAFAMSFHVSAFMLAFMYPLYHAKITKKWLYVIVPCIAVIFAFNEPIFLVLTTILSRFTRFEGEISSTGAYTMLFLMVLFSVFSFVIPDNSRIDTETIGLRNFLLLSLVIQLFAPLHSLAMRLVYYYIIFIPLLLPKIIQYRSKRWNQVAIIGRHIMVIFFLVYFFANAYSGGGLYVFPYHFFWENV